jgi:hypothetical protein
MQVLVYFVLHILVDARVIDLLDMHLTRDLGVGPCAPTW